MPRVSVVIPLYNGGKYIERALRSVTAQSYSDFEVLIISEHGNNDGGDEIVQSFAKIDNRFRLIKNKTRLGLAESLNLGFREAKGEYIARLDSDDTAFPERFEKQISFMDSHRDVGLCGTWQLHYANGFEWIHRAEPDPDKLRCVLLFWCDLCHSTLMLRKNEFLKNNLFYSPFVQAEDFELWTRAMQFMKIANIPEVLGTYNEKTGITTRKKLLINNESGVIVAKTLENLLGLKLSKDETMLLNGWINPLEKVHNRAEKLQSLKNILYNIWLKNKEIKFFNNDFLIQMLAAKWCWAKYNINWKTDYSNIHDISEALFDSYRPGFFVRYKTFCDQYPGFFNKVKKIIKKLASILLKTIFRR